MFNALLLVKDDTDCAAIENLALASKQVFFQRALSRFPPAFELAKILNTVAPDLVFLDLSEWDSALAAARDIRQLSPLIPLIGFGAGWEPEKQDLCTAAGITELLVSPVTLKAFQDCVDRAIHKRRPAIQENLFAFLPAKAGSGCTTIALNTAGRLANNPATNTARKALLIEGDLRSGVVSALLDIQHRYSLRDALDNSEQLDYSRWTSYVARAWGLDLLISHQRQTEALPSWTHYHHLLRFAALRYDSILVDLPEVVNDATVEIVRLAERVFVVCTPELPSLALAPRRCEELTSRGIPAEKIAIIVNRWHKGEIAGSDVEKLLTFPVSVVFENDYGAVSKAARGHRFVDPKTSLGRSFAAFARKLAKAPETRNGFNLGFLKGLVARGAPQPRV